MVKRRGCPAGWAGPPLLPRGVGRAAAVKGGVAPVLWRYDTHLTGLCNRVKAGIHSKPKKRVSEIAAGDKKSVWKLNESQLLPRKVIKFERAIKLVNEVTTNTFNITNQIITHPKSNPDNQHFLTILPVSLESGFKEKVNGQNMYINTWLSPVINILLIG